MFLSLRYVWSPAGGWWANPRQWRLHTGTGIGVLLVSYWMMSKYGAENAIAINTVTHEATRPKHIRHTSVWDLNTGLPTGPQYEKRDHTTGRIKEDGGDDE